jgi:hypothetical protein
MKATEAVDIKVGAVGATGSYESLIPSSWFIRNVFKLRGITQDNFPLFPNPHLRSNAFMVERKIFTDFAAIHKIPCSKREVWMFESGKKGFTAFLRDYGLKPLVVGANGRYYAPQNWIESGTFRVPGQPNILIEDNQTRAYTMANQNDKRRLEKLTWGKTFS